MKKIIFIIVVVLLLMPFAIAADSANVTLIDNVSKESSTLTAAKFKDGDNWVYKDWGASNKKTEKDKIITSIAKALKDFFKALGLS